MSGKKKLFRQGVDLANSRRMRVRRRARPRIVRHATRQIIIVVTIAVAFWATMDFFVETWLPHNPVLPERANYCGREILNSNEL